MMSRSRKGVAMRTPSHRAPKRDVFYTEGRFVSIMGPSGSGKSTLLHILSFLDRPTGGMYLFRGKGIDEMDDRELAHVRNSGMGFVFRRSTSSRASPCTTTWRYRSFIPTCRRASARRASRRRCVCRPRGKTLLGSRQALRRTEAARRDCARSRHRSGCHLCR